eukprot:14575614-Ditylum_brightwellii.AAC.1
MKAYGYGREVLNALHLANSQVNYQNIPCHQCTAHKFLKVDIAAGKNKIMKPHQIGPTGEKYMIDQEVDQVLKVERRAHFGKKKMGS